MKPIIILLITTCFSYSQSRIIDDKNGVRIIFSDSAGFQTDTLDYYTLTEKEIDLLENDWRKMTNGKIPEFKEKSSNIKLENDWATTDMKKYIRQYSGFLNAKNEVLIFVNFLAKDDLTNNQDFKSHWIFNLPCCKSYRMTYSVKMRNFKDLNFLKSE